MKPSFSFTATLLTLSGVLPFILSVLIAVFPEFWSEHLPIHTLDASERLQTLGLISLGMYGAIILSFMAGARWGGEIQNTEGKLHKAVMLEAVLPAIAAWPCAIWIAASPDGSAGALAILAIVFVMLLLWDLRTGYPRWYKALRVLATSGAVICLSVGAITALLI